MCIIGLCGLLAKHCADGICADAPIWRLLRLQGAPAHGGRPPQSASCRACEIRGESPFCHLVGPDWGATGLRRLIFTSRACLGFCPDADYETYLPEMLRQWLHR